VVCKFRQYNNPIFSHIVFSREELIFWQNDANVEGTFPMVVLIKSEWEKRTVLLKLPSTTYPPLAARVETWQEDLEKALRECLIDVPADDEVNKVWWRNYIGSVGEGGSTPTGLFAQRNAKEMWPFPLVSGSAAMPPTPCNFSARESAAAAVYAPIMRSGASEAAPLVRAHKAPALTELVPLSFAWVRVDGGAAGDAAGASGGGSDEEPFPLQYCLVQMPRSFPAGFDTKDPTARVRMSWWKPEKADKGYEGRWRVWFKGQGQWAEPERRGAIGFTDVQVWASSVAVGPLRNRWVRVAAPSLKVLPAK
jgi:hypothetical protein